MARQVADQAGYALGYDDPVRAIQPYSPNELVTTGSRPTVPIVGVIVVAAALLILEHLRRRRGR